MRWGGWVVILFCSLSHMGCSYLPRRRRPTDYEQIKQQKIEDHKEDLKRIRGKEPGQLY